jgi:hypothetical protein
MPSGQRVLGLVGIETMVSFILPFISPLYRSRALETCLGSLVAPRVIKCISEAHTNMRIVKEWVSGYKGKTIKAEL